MRRQPPAHSPLTAAALARAALRAATRWDAESRLRELLAAGYGAGRVLLLDSGTTALRRAIELAAARAGRDAIVAIPAFTCYDVASAAVAAGRPVTLFDIDPETLGPDPDSLRRALADGARVVVITPLYGIPVDWDGVAAAAAEAGAILIEDAAQGHGATWRGRPLGGFGPLAVLSFGRGKGWTGGRGGAVLLREGFAEGDAPPAANTAPPPSGLGTLAVSAAQWMLGRPSLYALPASLPWLGLGETRYHECGPPRGLPRAAAALLLATHAAAQREAAVRRDAARQYLAALDAEPHVACVRPAPGAEPGYLRFPLRVRGGIHGLGDAHASLRLGIAPSYPTPLAALGPLVRLLVGSQRVWPGAETLARDLITLPTHSRVSAKERDRLIRHVRAARA